MSCTRESKILADSQGFKNGLAGFSSVGLSDLLKSLALYVVTYQMESIHTDFNVHDKKFICKT